MALRSEAVPCPAPSEQAQSYTTAFRPSPSPTARLLPRGAAARAGPPNQNLRCPVVPIWRVD
eukprot:6221435-Alexandrium_andersonii.AAC.1